MEKKTEDIRLGEKIRNIRNSLGMDQKTFSKKIGSTVSALSNWENGRNKPKEVYAKKIAELGNVSFDEFIHGSYESVIKGLIDEANYFATHGEFNELELKPKGLKDTLREISSFYWRYYIKVSNESGKSVQEKLESLFETLSSECKSQGVLITDHKKIFRCIHSFFTNTIFLESYSNTGFIDYTIDHLMNVTNEKLPNYIELANKQNMSIDSDLYASTVEALSETMNKIDKSKKEYPNE